MADMDVDEKETLDLIAHVEEMLFNKIDQIQDDQALFREEITAKVNQNNDSALVKKAEDLEKENQTLTKEVTKLKKDFKKQQDIIQRLEAEAVEKDVWSHLQTLKRNATKLKTTIKKVHENIEDPSETRQYLFGAKEEDTLRCLRRIRERAPFGMKDCRVIRDLFVKTNLFMRKKWPDFCSEIPKSKNLVASDTLCFNLEPSLRPTDTSRTEELLKKDTDFKQSLSYITMIHTQKRVSESVDCSRRKNFADFLTLLVMFIDAIQPLNYQIDQEHASTVDDELITIISEGKDEERFLFEVIDKVLPRYKTEDPNNLEFEYQDIQDKVERLVGYMVREHCLYGMLTDDETVLFIEYDLDAWEDSPIYDKTLPIVIRSTHRKATNPSCIETMTSWILSMQPSESTSEMMDELFGINTNYDTTDALVLPTINYFDVLHQKKAPFQVYQVFAEDIEGFDHGLQPNDHMVAKIFDPIAASAYSPFASFSLRLEGMQKVYALERECASRLSQDPEFNNCYYDQGEVFASVRQSDYLCSGQCLISKYIESERLPNDEETYQKVKQQIKIVHRNNIVHNDIAPRNILYTRDKKVYLIDFGVATLDEEEKEIGDYEMLDELFADRNKRNKEKYLS